MGESYGSDIRSGTKVKFYDHKLTEYFIKGFTDNAKVKVIDDKLIELPMLGDHYTKIELHRECNTRSEGTSF